MRIYDCRDLPLLLSLQRIGLLTENQAEQLGYIHHNYQTDGASNDCVSCGCETAVRVCSVCAESEPALCWSCINPFDV